MSEERLVLRHPKSDPPKDYSTVFIFPQCVRATYECGFFVNSGFAYLGVELWCYWLDLFDRVDFPKDHEPGKQK